MATNTNLTRDLAEQLVKQKDVICPKCGSAKLTPRHRHKQQNVEYKCVGCGEVYRPCKMI